MRRMRQCRFLKNIKILPELADYLDPLDPETFEKLKAQIARDGLTDPICYAEITRPRGRHGQRDHRWSPPLPRRQGGRRAPSSGG